jgi:hypothetical protein
VLYLLKFRFQPMETSVEVSASVVPAKKTFLEYARGGQAAVFAFLQNESAPRRMGAPI